ncbi:MAG: DUF2283 domain-containing protein [Prevotellaceae bacterium]|nr:DUF2283 domain-containing protein [Prevotellaceae bacterium]
MTRSAFCYRAPPVAESSEDKSGVIIDYSMQGNIVGVEALNASQKMVPPNMLEYEAL